MLFDEGVLVTFGLSGKSGQHFVWLVGVLDSTVAEQFGELLSETDQRQVQVVCERGFDEFEGQGLESTAGVVW